LTPLFLIWIFVFFVYRHPWVGLTSQDSNEYMVQSKGCVLCGGGESLKLEPLRIHSELFLFLQKVICSYYAVQNKLNYAHLGTNIIGAWEHYGLVSEWHKKCIISCQCCIKKTCEKKIWWWIHS